MKLRALRTFLVLLTPLLLLCCETENWNLVDPPAGRDSVMVRFLNYCGDGAVRYVTLDGTLNTQQTPDSSVSATINATADSAFVTAHGLGSEILAVSGRMHFSKQSNELLIAVPSLPEYAKKRALDTLLHFSTTRQLLTVSGYSALRLIVCSDDSVGASYEMHVGCPNGTLLGTTTATRQSTAYTTVPAKGFVVSLLRNQQVVGVYNLNLTERYYYSLIVGLYNGHTTVRVLDEFNSTASALTVPTVVQQNQRQALIRCVNASATTVDSVTSGSGVSLCSKLGGQSVGTYRLVTTCASDVSDVFQLWSGQTARANVSTSLGVNAKYTLVSFDSAQSSAAALVMVPPTITATPADSVTVRVVNSLVSGRNLHVRLGARTDAGGVYRNGEVVAPSTAYGNVSNAVRIKPGIAPITVLSDSSNDPETLLGCFVGTLQAGKEYLFIVTGVAGGTVQLSVVESSEENTTLSTLKQGVYTQLVNARVDHASSLCSISGVFSGVGLNFGGGLSTVVPEGSASVNMGYQSKQASFDTTRRMTWILCGDAANPKLIIIDSLSMHPEAKLAKSRYLNVAGDQGSILLGVVDSTAPPNYYRTVIDNLQNGSTTTTYTDANPHRVSYVCAQANGGNVFYRPDYPLTFTTGKAYTLIVTGSSATGYAIVLQQEY